MLSETPGPPHNPDRGFEDYPLTRQEYITVMVHFYRGEIHRSTVSRQRLDATTNWAVLTTAAMLSFAFAEKQHHHIVLLLSNLIVLCYLFIEARRFRYFEVYRARVRMIEENFLSPVIRRKLESPKSAWRESVAQDLGLPKYKTTLLEAVGFRLRRNYCYVFLIVLGGWVVKILLHPQVALSWEDVWGRIGIGAVPASVVLGAGVLFYLTLVAVMWFSRHIHAGEPEDEVVGIEQHLEDWKL